ncbi:protoheme IX farnesyltransferase [Aureimonas populi]|uniref:Protoheme IX farnesyltransferase n=1 Tax=Aureimonas populi TaxID=1701758 RepID=A0ABW5CRX9_9HYPH|nr:protoheme IX farnesyltransferase [Aureimonas populi]
MDEDRVSVSPAELKARRRRSLAIAGALVAVVVLFYVVTIIRIGS